MTTSIQFLFFLFLFAGSLVGNELGNFQISHVFEKFLGFVPTNYTFYPIAHFTNKIYLVKINEHEKYIFRFPGYETNAFIDRGAEKNNSIISYNHGFNPANVLYSDILEGVQVTDCVEAATAFSQAEFYDQKNISEIALHLKKIHTSKMPFTNKIDVFAKIHILIGILRRDKFLFPQSFELAKQLVDPLKKNLSPPLFIFVPIHGDPVPGNFVRSEKGLQMNDWEYSGLFDPAYDLAYFSTVMNFSKAEDLFLINSYAGNMNPFLHAKVIFFKPIVEFWLGLWGCLQSASHQKLTEKEFFLNFAISHFKKCENYIASQDFQKALRSFQ